MKKLTERQQAILSFIEQYWQKNGISPSFRDIQQFFGFQSPHAVTKHLAALEQKGMLRLRKFRGIGRARGIIPLFKKKGEVPLVGRIVAGTPVESGESIEEILSLDSLGIDNSRRDHFALRVAGNSMINAHILDGDIAVIRKQTMVSRLEVAAVLLEGEATLKYVDKRKNRIRLIPANDALEPIILDAHQAGELTILGKAVMILRRLAR